MDYKINNFSGKTIKELPAEEKPREKIKISGAKSLSDAELICALLGNGCAGVSVNKLAENILEYLSLTDKQDTIFEHLATIKGMGMAQTAVICAAIEFGRRQQRPIKIKYATSNAVFEHIKHFGDRNQEHMLCIMFNGAMEIIGTKVITVGLVNKTLVHPREIFAEALKERSTAIIIAHNHPSGNVSPSDDDIAVTQSILTAGKILGIQVLDHIIFSETQFYSMSEHGDIWFN